ncbi:chemotaxis protein CheW [Fusibacter sp. JL216-2]|uniref:chemotaxis protein CheW n=1 Tax=Fusibacter sp. JL216-2 TaxID=3071453 RepID=UPI003D349983|tara:strand:- start:175 stop:615 length:441 start_codon:yes stop_codon:yes gene_type:complete
MSNIKEYVVFRVKEESYGIDIKYVENIEKMLPITRVPYTDEHVEGVVNLRGNVIPVIDLRKRFSIPREDFTDESRIIIVNYKEYTVGMIADSSSEVFQIDRDNVDPAPSIKAGSDDFVREIGKHDGRIVMLIDLKKVLGIESIEAE